MSGTFGTWTAIAVAIVVVAVVGAASEIWKRSKLARIPMTFRFERVLPDCCLHSSVHTVEQAKARLAAKVKVRDMEIGLRDAKIELLTTDLAACKDSVATLQSEKSHLELENDRLHKEIKALTASKGTKATRKVRDDAPPAEDWQDDDDDDDYDPRETKVRLIVTVLPEARYFSIFVFSNHPSLVCASLERNKGFH
jgi:regulator of replication initiation timing